MLTEEHIKEGLSRAYVHAVAARAGVDVASPGFDYGVDGLFSRIKVRENRHYDSGVMLGFQLKSTTVWELRDNCIIYDLETKTYNDLVSRDERSVPLVLILMCLPTSTSVWVTVDHLKLSLYEGCYWFKPSDKTLTRNKSSTRISIPRQQLLDMDALNGLLDDVEFSTKGRIDA